MLKSTWLGQVFINLTFLIKYIKFNKSQSSPCLQLNKGTLINAFLPPALLHTYHFDLHLHFPQTPRQAFILWDQAPGLLGTQHLSEWQHHRDQGAAAERKAPLPPHSTPVSSVMLCLFQQHTPHGPKHLSASDTVHREAQLNLLCCVTSPRRMFYLLTLTF